MFRLFLEIIFSLNLIHFRSFNIVQPYHKNLNKHPTSFRRPEKTSKVEQGSASWGGAYLKNFALLNQHLLYCFIQ